MATRLHGTATRDAFASSEPAIDQAGLTRHVEVGLRLAAPVASAAVLAKSLGGLFDEVPTVPVRLVGAGLDRGRVVLTVAVTLGTVEEIKAAGPSSVAAVEVIRRIVESLAGYDPAFAVLPDPQSAEAALARRLVEDGAIAGSGLLARIG